MQYGRRLGGTEPLPDRRLRADLLLTAHVIQ